MIDAQGHVKFKFREPRNTTVNFSSDRKLGKEVAAYLKRMGMELVVKQVSMSSNSRWGEQEFVVEMNTISKLSHRNLVKLIGWCHERGELQLVYEYFPLGSLDELLYADARAGVLPPELTQIKLDKNDIAKARRNFGSFTVINVSKYSLDLDWLRDWFRNLPLPRLILKEIDSELCRDWLWSS
jgi:serine/threonine protein kinase